MIKAMRWFAYTVLLFGLSFATTTSYAAADPGQSPVTQSNPGFKYFSDNSFWEILKEDGTGKNKLNANADLSLIYLSQIFGGVNNMLVGDDNTILSQLFYRLNQGFCILAGGWLAYVISQMVMRSSHDGSFLGQQNNIASLALRVSIGIGLLMPLPGSGYSLLQTAVIYVVKQGVGLADTTWTWALEFLKKGGSVKVYNAGVTDKAGRGNFSQDILVDNQPALTTFASSMFKSMVCVQAWKQIGPVDPSKMHAADWSYDPAAKKILFSSPYAYGAAPNDRCGYISTDKAPGLLPYGDILLPIVKNLEAPAASYARTLTMDSAPPGQLEKVAKQIVVPALFQAASDYTRAWTFNYPANEGDESKKSEFITPAQKYGWITAGRYFWDLVQSEATTAKVKPMEIADSLSADAPGHYPDPTACGDQDRAICTGMQYFNGAADPAGVIGEPLNGNYRELRTVLDQLYKDRSDTESHTSILGSKFDATGNDAKNVYGAIAFLADGFGHLLQDLCNGVDDPIIFLHNVGDDCITAGLDIWIFVVLISAILTFFASICSAVLPLGATIATITNLLGAPFILMMGLPMLGAGLTLGYYVVLYPFFVFVFCSFGWVVSVIEAMVAAPLICLGLTHPEGHIILGKIEQALMILLGVFLRPVLMIMGLISAIVTAYVLVRLGNYGFSGIITDMMGGGMDTVSVFKTIANSSFSHTFQHADWGMAVGGLLLAPLTGGLSVVNIIVLFMKGIFLMAGLLCIYSMFLYELVTHVFGLIHQLPDRILRWIGQSGENYGGEAHGAATRLQTAMSGAGQSASAIGQNAGKAGETAGQAGAKLVDEKKNNASSQVSAKATPVATAAPAAAKTP